MRWKYAELSKTLSGLYYSQEKIVQLLILAGFSPGDFDLHNSAYTTFTFLIRSLEQKRLLDRVLSEVKNEFPENRLVEDILNRKPSDDWHSSIYSGPELTVTDADRNFNFEAITDNINSLLPISFLATGLEKARSVAKIITPKKLGTGFLIAEAGILLTNNHVINSRSLLSGTEVFFNFQKDVNDLAEVSQKFGLDNDFFYTSAEDDWTIVKLTGYPERQFGHIELVNTSIKKNDCVNIIQHPGGEYKQISLYHNVVAYADDRKVRYLTDTLPGSSGSPVFNSEWEVVALHNSGGYFPVKDGSKILCNQGININQVINGVSEFLK